MKTWYIEAELVYSPGFRERQFFEQLLLQGPADPKLCRMALQTKFATERQIVNGVEWSCIVYRIRDLVDVTDGNTFTLSTHWGPAAEHVA